MTAPSLEEALKACVRALNALDAPHTRPQFLAVQPALEKGRQALASHMVGMRSQELYDAALLERNHWQDRAMLAELALMRAHNRIAHVIEFYADPASWNSGDVPGHVYAYDDGGWMARQLCADGWTTKGKAWLVAGAPVPVDDLEIK